MKPRKIPMRMCVGCREIKPKIELLRVVKTPEGEILLDFSGKVSGRGAYVCPNKECLERAVKQKQLDRALEVVLDDEVIKDLEKALEKTTPIKGDKA